MATLIEIRTFSDILSAIIESGKIATSIDTVDDDTLTTIKRFVNDRYNAVSFSKKWPWREETRLLKTTPKYNTGTASVVSDQKEVTLSAAATVTSDMVGSYFYVTGKPEYYEIISITNAPNRKFMLAAPYNGATDTAAGYTIFRNKYGMFPDYADIVEVTPFGANNLFSPSCIDVVSSEEMSQLQALYPFRNTQYPTHYTIQDNINYDGPEMGSNFVMGYDFMGVGPSEQSIVFFPNIFSTNVIQIKYGLQVTLLTEDDDEPIIPREKRKVLVHGALADWWDLQGKNEIAARHEKKYADMLSHMIADFDKGENRTRIIAKRRRRKGSRSFPIMYPEVQ